MKNWTNPPVERDRPGRGRRRPADGTLRNRQFSPFGSRSFVPLTIGALALTFLVCPQAAHACSACFGKSDSPMAKGMNAGIFAMLAIVGSVLTCAASFFVFLARRASSLEKEQQATVPETKTE